jgi:hypothetical protein
LKESIFTVILAGEVTLVAIHRSMLVPRWRIDADRMRNKDTYAQLRTPISFVPPLKYTLLRVKFSGGP